MPMLVHSPKELALLIANQRKKLKLSQAAVGSLVGLQQKTISAIENKPERMQVDTLFRVLAALKLDLQLLGKDERLKSKSRWLEEW